MAALVIALCLALGCLDGPAHAQAGIDRTDPRWLVYAEVGGALIRALNPAPLQHQPDAYGDLIDPTRPQSGVRVVALETARLSEAWTLRARAHSLWSVRDRLWLPVGDLSARYTGGVWHVGAGPMAGWRPALTGRPDGQAGPLGGMLAEAGVLLGPRRHADLSLRGFVGHGLAGGALQLRVTLR